MAYHNDLYGPFTRDVQRRHGSLGRLAARCLPAILVGGLWLILLSSLPAKAVTEDVSQGNFNGLTGGQLLMKDRDSDRYTSALIHASKVHFDVSGMIAIVRLEQSFRNDGDTFMEGVYAFPLPDNAAVRHMEMEVGERKIVGKVREKSLAKKIYQKARQEGKKASLVEQQRPNLFTNRIANIGPGEEVIVRLEYVQPIDFQADAFSLRFPMTITPRYMPGTPTNTMIDRADDEVLVLNPYVGWATPTDQVPDADAISPLLYPELGNERSPLNPIEITARLDVGMPLANVESPYHDIALSRRAGVYTVNLMSGVSEMDRDFVLTWQPVTGAVPQAALFTERVGEEYFGLLMVVPPIAERIAPPVAREIIFVVDTSGSMGGVSIEQARASVSQALQQLRAEDRFNIIEFNSYHRALYRATQAATRDRIQQAQEFVRQLDASGGTEMLPALQAALISSPEPDASETQPLLRQVIFITDGAVGNESELFEQLSAHVGVSRLFTVGIGSAPNSWFMRKAAQFGRGTYTHIGDLNEVGQKMGDLFEQLSHPVMVDVAVDWPSTVEAWPRKVPDLYQGQPLSLAVNFGATAPVGEVTVTGRIAGRDWTRRLQLEQKQNTESDTLHSGVASLWARRKIAGLLDEIITGREEAAVRADVLPLALQHQLLSPYTSFVAVEEVVSRPRDQGLQTKSVPNTRPKGQTNQHFAYPKTATTGPAKAWLGVLALFVALMVRTLRLPEADHVSNKEVP
jgi:Ca-activated chloride channel family protein